MERIVFEVQGSAADPYQVAFSKANSENMTATCTCVAGTKGIYCKHRIGILKGEKRGIVSGNQADVDRIVEWVKGTDIEKALSEIAECEDALTLAEAKLAKAKKALAKSMKD